jgi:hypothetical protein
MGGKEKDIIYIQGKGNEGGGGGAEDTKNIIFAETLNFGYDPVQITGYWGSFVVYSRPSRRVPR